MHLDSDSAASRAPARVRASSGSGSGSGSGALRLLLMLVVPWLLSCASVDSREQAPETIELDSIAQELERAPAAPLLYYALTRDVRRCAAPRCGGYFVRAVNQPFTRCVDGSRAQRCYVASVDWSGAGGAPPETVTLLAQGRIEAEIFPGVGTLGRLVAVSALGAATSASPTGTYYLVTDNGLRCIQAPCFSFDALVLNRRTTRKLSNLNLAGVGASPAQLESAGAALTTAGLVVSGYVRSTGRFQAPGRELLASQIFLSSSPKRCYGDESCAAGERCNAADICLPPPCAAGMVCPAVCTGYCVVDDDLPCREDTDCSEGTWCRATASEGTACVPFAREGEACGGFTLPWDFQRCAPKLGCDTPPRVADAAGICRTPCASSEECSEGEYCASDDFCHADGSCELTADCNLEGNAYVHIECVGYGVCITRAAQCGYTCGDPRCVDVLDYDFGPCDAVLGWASTQGVCTEVSGCSAAPFTLFSSREECNAACGGP